MSALVHTGSLAARHLRAFVRVPAFFAMNLVQPLIWLLLFGQLFRSVAQIPGFTGGDYLTFLTPGIVMMMAMFGAAWTGTGFIQDMERGVMDRLLTSATSRGAMIVSTLVYQSVLTVLQTLVLLAVAWVAGVRFGGGAAGVSLLVVAAVLLTVVFGALSDAIALTTRQHNALIGVSQMLAFPLMFLSSAIMDTSLSPGWVATVARFNPFEWAVVAGRGAIAPDPQWSSVAGISASWPRRVRCWWSRPPAPSAATSAPPEPARPRPRDRGMSRRPGARPMAGWPGAGRPLPSALTSGGSRTETSR